MVNIEYRKLIKFGGSSFIISIPNLWLKKNNLKKGDVIYVEEDGGSRLILAPTNTVKREEKKVVIDTNNKSEHRVKEEVYRVYTDGADVIKLMGGNINKINEGIRKILNNLMAMEVIEQTNNTLIATNFLNIEDIKVRSVIRRVDIILRSMFVDSIESKKFEGVVNRDVDVNRLCYMLLRILKMGISDPGVSRKIGVDGIELLHVWFMILNMERIGDEVKRISRFLNRVKLDNKQKKELKKIYSDIELAYLDVMKSYYKDNKELAFDVSSRKDDLYERCNKFFEKNNVSVIGGMIEKMKGLTSWIGSIASVSYG